jgi:carbon storage regulator
MLYLTRRQGEAVIINNEIEVQVIELKGNTVKLGFTFPPTATVLRAELHRQISEANAGAALEAGNLTAVIGGTKNPAGDEP